VVIICQETKDGQSAGPNELRHLVDALLSLIVVGDVVDEESGEEGSRLRLLSSSKNRFGPDRAGYLEMSENGLASIDKPTDAGGDDSAGTDAMLPIAQELLHRLLELGGTVDGGLRDRIAGRLDLESRGSR
jgi:predicted ATP-dependent serine protease